MIKEDHGHSLTPLEVEIEEISQAFSKVVPIELDEMDSRQYVEFIWLFKSLYSNGEMMDQVKWMMKENDDNSI